MLLQIFAWIVMLGLLSVLIIVHEFGHFSVARLFGFQTPVFGFGLPFGPSWVVGRRWGTEFRVHACLLGGYVAIPELGDESNAKEENYGVALKPFRKFPIWQRALVAFAGVGFNIIFAYLVMLTMLTTIGQPALPVVVHSLPVENPIAKEAGVLPGDQVMSVDNIKMAGPDDVVSYLGQHKNTGVTVTIKRNEELVNIPMTTNANGKVGMALVTKGGATYQKVDKDFLSICQLAGVKLWNLTSNMVEATGMLFQGIFSPHSGAKTSAAPAVGVEDLHGVLAVLSIGANIVLEDWKNGFLFIIMISMDLAIINLLPWPALDGGHLAFMLFEAVRGKPMGERMQGEIVKWGFVSLLLLMAVIMVNDVRALLSGKLDINKVKSNKEETKQVEKPGNAFWSNSLKAPRPAGK